MRNRKKGKRFAGLLVLLALLGAFALSGCGKKSDQVDSPAEERDTEEEAKDGAEEEPEDASDEEGTGEEAADENEEAESTVELSDTVRWFNASYAILTELNGWDYNIFAGLPANDMVKELEVQSLEQWWSVTDRKSADDTLQWALNEGHRTEFASLMQELSDAGMSDVAQEERVNFMLQHYEVTEEKAQLYVNWYAMFEQYGAGAIDGWDYCRALNLVSFYYLAQYYTEEEALNKSLEIAQMVQPLFGSWEELVESYLRGYEYWAEESAEERRQVFEDLKSRPDNPYQVDYNTKLEKTW